jgi:hypothetical protein
MEKNKSENPATTAGGVGGAFSASVDSNGVVVSAPDVLEKAADEKPREEKKPRRNSPRRAPAPVGPVQSDAGHSVVRFYFLTKGEMWALGGAGLVWGAFYSLGSFLIGFRVDAQMNLALAQGVKPETLAQWQAYSDGALYAGIVCFVVASAAVIASGFGIAGVIKRTRHKEPEAQ